MTTTTSLTYLTDNSVALETLLQPYIAKLSTGTPLTPQELAKYKSLCETKAELATDLDEAWTSLVKKPSLIQRIFNKF